MISATATVNLPFMNNLPDAKKQAAIEVANEAMKDTSPFVPHLTGSLDRSAHIVESNTGAAIIYGGGGVTYARYLYYGMLMVDPETGSAWARKGTTKVLTDKPLKYSTGGHPKACARWFVASKAENLEKWKGTARKALIHYGK